MDQSNHNDMVESFFHNSQNSNIYGGLNGATITNPPPTNTHTQSLFYVTSLLKSPNATLVHLWPFFGFDFVDSSRFNRWNEQGIICFTWMKCSVRCVRRTLKTKGTMIGKVKVFSLYPCVLLVSFRNTMSLSCGNKHEESTGCFKERPTKETNNRRKNLHQFPSVLFSCILTDAIFFYTPNSSRDVRFYSEAE